MTRHERTTPVADRRAWERLPPVHPIALLAVTLIGLYICYLLALPFLPALAWALTLAVLVAPLHRRLERKIRHRGLAAAVSVVLTILLVILPLTLVGQRLLAELSSGVVSVKTQFSGADLQRAAEQYPLLARAYGAIGQHIDLPATLGTVASWLTNLGATIVRGSLSYLLTLVLTFYLLFYFLRDRHEARGQLRLLSPLTDSETDRVFGRVADTIYAMVFGTALAAIVQGALGGAMFWLLGLPNPMFWGIVMGLLAIVPFLGAFLVWIPAAAYLFLIGDWGKAAVLVGWGAIVIGGADNILHPVLAGGRLRMHTVPMFIAIVGGLMLFGPSGLVLGPLAVTTTMTLLEIWRARINREHAEPDVETPAVETPASPTARTAQ